MVVGDYVVVRAAYVDTHEEARRYYQERLAGQRHVTCQGRPVVLFFERAAIHVYTEERPVRSAMDVIVRRRLSTTVTEERVFCFCLDRARLMDHIIPAVCNFTFSLPGTSAANRNNRLLHGPQLPDGRYLRVVLSKGPRDMWYCKTAYPIDARKWRDLRGAKTATFP